MVDAKFLAFFNEVAQDNFVAVAKQNLLFQAQIRTLEEHNKIIPELQKKIEDLEVTKGEVKVILQENNDLKNQLNQKNAVIENSSKFDTDRHRLQTAVNTQSKEIAGLKKTIEELNQETEKEKDYIRQLEDMLPNSKRKKLGLTVVEDKKKEEDTEEVQNDEKKLEIVTSGGTF
jgi:septal ring factor EnvC (AmiA/AmiB activator)